MPAYVPLSLDNMTSSELETVEEILNRNKELIKQKKYYELINGIEEIDYASFVTLVLYRSGIDPLKYMTGVPDFYLAGTDIKNITIPQGITEIGSNVFENCEHLRKITLPQSLKRVGGGFCNSCESLTEVNFTGTNAEFDEIDFGLGKNAMPDSFIYVQRIICSDDDKYN